MYMFWGWEFCHMMFCLNVDKNPLNLELSINSYKVDNFAFTLKQKHKSNKQLNKHIFFFFPFFFFSYFIYKKIIILFMIFRTVVPILLWWIETAAVFSCLFQVSLVYLSIEMV